MLVVHSWSLFIEFFIFRIFFLKLQSPWWSTCSVHCFLNLLNFLSLFSHISRSIFKNAILNSLLFMSHISMSLFVFRFNFFFYLPCYLGYSGIWWIPSLTRHQYVSGASLADWYKQVFLIFSNRWCWITRWLFFYFLFFHCEIPMLIHCLWLPSV